jgi:putative Mg2+ transporter-C (MgtC) family protein
MGFSQLFSLTLNSGVEISTVDQYLVDLFNNFAPPLGNFLLVLVSMLMAALFSGIIGYEREYHGHSAGLRTHILVALGSALVMIISIYGFSFDYADRDPARLAAQVVSGIGFLGAGTIIQTGTDIKGLTTATTLWFVMAIGLAAGAGRFTIAAFATALAFVTLVILRKVEHYASRKAPKVIIVVPIDTPVLKPIHLTASHLGISLKEIQSQVVTLNNQQMLRITLSIAYMSRATSAAFLEELKSLIHPVEIRITTGY